MLVNIAGNSLAELRIGAPAWLPSLQQLSAERNAITSLSIVALPCLHSLNLGHNRYFAFVDLRSILGSFHFRLADILDVAAMFTSCVSLAHVSLHGNPCCEEASCSTK